MSSDSAGADREVHGRPHPRSAPSQAFGITGGLRGRGEREARRDDEECGAAARRVLERMDGVHARTSIQRVRAGAINIGRLCGEHPSI